MPLPPVHGWLIDYRTAHIIFASKSNVRIDHIIARCQAGNLHICHREESKFRADDLLLGPFIDDQCCVYEPDDDVYDRCPAVEHSAAAVGKTLLVGSEAAVFMTALAIAKQFGVISDHTSPRFATVHDLCPAYGVPVLTADQYFQLI